MNPIQHQLPLVLLHAFPFDHTMWEPQRRALGERVVIIAPDLPGFGDAPGLDEEALTMERAALAVREIIESRGIERCVLGGLSMGGYIAFECWRQFPELIAGIVLADTRAEADSEEVRKGRYDALERIGAGQYEEFCDLLLRKLLADETRRTMPDVVDDARRIMLSVAPQNAAAAVLGLAGRRDSMEVLPTIDVPCAIIVGEHDVVTPPEAARVMADGIPDATLEIIPGAGHMSNMEQPDAFNAAVLRLLERVAVPEKT